MNIFMNRFAATIALFTSLAVAGTAQEPPPAAQPAPRIVCDQPEFDFGTVDNTESVEHTFVLRNAGDLTLEITQARPACGCTVASISERNVPPGGESRITSRLSLAGRQGQQHKTITVESNDPNQPQLMLVLKGVAGSSLEIQPPRITQGQIPAGSQPTNVVALSSPPHQFFQVTSVEPSSDRFQARVETVETGRVYRLLVWPSQPLAAGQLDGAVVIRTDHPQRPTVEIPVLLIANAELTIAPRELIFEGASEEPVTRYLILRTKEGTPCQVTKVETPDPEIQTALSPFGNNGVRIQLSNLRPRAELDQRVIRVYTGFPGQGPLDVRIRLLPAAPSAPSP